MNVEQDVLMQKKARLEALLASYESCLVAYSGGVDSVLLAFMGWKVLGNRCLAAIADSPSLPRREFEDATRIASELGFPLRVLETREFENPKYLENPINRCFFCKHELFKELEPLAAAEGFRVVAYGENASDLGDFRPGAEAARVFEVRSPLKDVGLSKTEIRDLSRFLGLPTAEKPQLACLSSRIPHGEVVSPEKLAMIEEGENLLRDLGFHELRVRHHEIKGGALARIELAREEFLRLLSPGFLQDLTEQFERFGFSQVTLDLRGYRRGGGMGMVPPGRIEASAQAKGG